MCATQIYKIGSTAMDGSDLVDHASLLNSAWPKVGWFCLCCHCRVVFLTTFSKRLSHQIQLCRLLIYELCVYCRIRHHLMPKNLSRSFPTFLPNFSANMEVIIKKVSSTHRFDVCSSFVVLPMFALVRFDRRSPGTVVLAVSTEKS
jgi:hypothetical protein